MEIDLSVRAYVRADEPQVIALWQACGLVVPWNDPKDDIEKKLAFQPELLLVGESGGRIVASVMVGYEGHRGWINYLAVDPARRKQSLGRRMMDAAESELRALGCVKINLQVRGKNTGVIAFYQRLGFRIDDTVSLGKRLDGKDWGTR